MNTSESNNSSIVGAESATNATPDALDAYGEHIEVDDPVVLHELRRTPVTKLLARGQSHRLTFYSLGEMRSQGRKAGSLLSPAVTLTCPLQGRP